jgi:hypothetical protein
MRTSHQAFAGVQTLFVLKEQVKIVDNTGHLVYNPKTLVLCNFLFIKKNAPAAGPAWMFVPPRRYA